MDIEKLIGNARTIALFCDQWGDTGKGKISDIIGAHMDYVFRGTGGANAGHTINVGGKEVVTHLVPAAIMHDANVTNIMGSGVAFDPSLFCGELDMLSRADMTYNNLLVAHNARLVLPQHRVLDALRESGMGSGGVGSTGKGIGPFYSDVTARIGITVGDLYNTDRLVAMLKKNLADKMPFLREADPERIREILTHADFNNGTYYHARDILDIDAIVAAYQEYGQRIKDMVTDTDALARSIVGKKRILLEGAQGLLLSSVYGSYPFVTSSDSSVHGLAAGSGLHFGHVDLALATVKAPYMTRVGDGPFPTEFGGKQSDDWCRTETIDSEIEKYPNVFLNDPDEFIKGVAVRRIAKEYGATTRRLRRTGRLDLPLLRYAAQINGRDIILTMMDVMTGSDEIEICHQYRYKGEPPFYIRNSVKDGVIITAIPQANILENCIPEYTTFPGWTDDITGAQSRDDLPQEVLDIVTFIEDQVGVNVRAISVGPDREQIVIM